MTNRAHFGIITLYTNFYGGIPSVDNTVNSQNRRPYWASSIVAALLCVVFSVLSIGFFVDGSVILAVVDFLISASLLAFVLVFFQNAIAAAPPIFALPFGVYFFNSGIESLFLVFGVIFFASLYAICHLRRVASFRQFFITAGAFSLVGAVMFCFIVHSTYGELGGGIVALGEKLTSAAPQLASIAAQTEGLEYSYALSMFESLLSSAALYLPAVIITLGIICAHFMRGIFELYTRAVGIGTLFVGRFELPPRALAAVYLICSFCGTIFGLFSTGMLFAVSNITLVLSLIFLVEGARFMIASVMMNIKSRTHQGRVVLLVVGLLFFTALFFVILPYYGAFRVLFSRRRTVK